MKTKTIQKRMLHMIMGTQNVILPADAKILDAVCTGSHVEFHFEGSDDVPKGEVTMYVVSESESVPSDAAYAASAVNGRVLYHIYQIGLLNW